MSFLTVVYLKADGTVDRSTNAYDTLDSAEVQYHVALASAMQKDYAKVIAMVFDLDGVVKFRRVWERA